MQQIIRLDNPSYKKIGYIDYSKNEREILTLKEEMIKKIPKENMVGLCYTTNYMIGDNLMANNNYEYNIYDVREYAVIGIKGIFTEKYALDKCGCTCNQEYSACSVNDILLFLPLSCIDHMNEFQRNNYISSLNELGFIELPIGFNEYDDDKIIELFKDKEEPLKVKVTHIKK